MQRNLRILFGTAAAAGLLVASTLAANSAIIIDVTVDAGGEAAAAQTAFLAGLSSSTNESFEGFTPLDQPDGTHSAVFNTDVGSFTKGGSDGTGICTQCDQLAILDAGTSPFSGRFALDGDNWLDSNDNSLVTWAVALAGSANFDSIGFFMTDVSDSGGTLTLTFDDGTQESEVFAGLGDGNLMYISVDFSSLVANATVTFGNDSTGDGWGIDDIHVGLANRQGIPEPMALGLLGLGLAGLGLVRRRRKAA